MRVKEDHASSHHLEAETGELLPERRAMSLVNANLAIPVNAALALNLLSDNATAYANAVQTGDIGQVA